MKPPQINKRNFQKTLRELDTTLFPSFKQDAYLVNVQNKLLEKKSLTLAEELIGYARFNSYLKGLESQANQYYVNNLDFSRYDCRPPKEYQKTGAKFLLKNNRAILADDTGLGKTLTAIMAALALEEVFKILIVTKNTLKYNIGKEISFYYDSYKVIEKKWEVGYKFTIINYDALKKFSKEIIEERFEVIIADECQALANSKSGRSKIFHKIIIDKTNKISKLWLLTGTPMNNRPLDLFNLLKIIKHPIANNWLKFVKRYCDGYEDEWGRFKITGASNLDELYYKTKDSILRRLKKDYLHDLPNKERQPVWLNLKNREGYDNVIEKYRQGKLEELLEWFPGLKEELIEYGIKDANEITKIIIWREFCALEKINDSSLIDMINEELDNGNKIIVFTNFTKVVDAVYNHFTDGICRFLDGRVDTKKRVSTIEEFNSDESLRLLVCNLLVGGTGLNVQSANVVIVNDMDWVPGNMLQAEDRAWRLGQLNEVSVKYLIYSDTVEEVLYNVIDKKMRIISTAIEGKRQNYFDHIVEADIKKERELILQEIFSKL